VSTPSLITDTTSAPVARVHKRRQR
jgi:hypothetical protein